MVIAPLHKIIHARIKCGVSLNFDAMCTAFQGKFFCHQGQQVFIALVPFMFNFEMILVLFQNAIELIMSKYREHMACLVNSTKIDSNFINQQKTVVSLRFQLLKLAFLTCLNNLYPQTSSCLTCQSALVQSNFFRSNEIAFKTFGQAF
jgi:hypothetical protein